VGHNEGTVSHCYSIGTVTGRSAGGLVGEKRLGCLYSPLLQHGCGRRG